MATTGTIKWTGYSTSESSVKLSYPYGSKELQMGVLVNGTMGPLDKGTISVMPINYKLKSGKTKVTQDFGPSVFSTTLPITITPATSYEHTTIEVLVSFANAPADAVLTAKTWID